MPPAFDEPSFAPPIEPGGFPGGFPDEPNGPGPHATREASGGMFGSLIAWVVILAMVGLLVVMRGGGPGPTAGEGAVVEIPSDDAVASAIMTIQGRYALGVSRLPGMGASVALAGDQLYDQTAAAIPTAPPKVRLRLAVLAAELAGPDRALEVLDELDAVVAAVDAHREGGFALEADDVALATDLRFHLESLASGGDGTFDAADEARFAEALGWWGQVAAVLPGADTASDRDATLAPAGRTVFVVLGGFATAGVAGVIGFVLLILAIVRVAGGRWLASPITPVSQQVHGRLAETFAIWIVLFFALQVLAGTLAATLGGGAAGGMAAAFIAFALSMTALIWPRVRGVSAADLAVVSGLNRGRGLFREIGAGVVGYLATLPLLGIGLLGTVLLAAASGLIGGLADGGGPVDPAMALLPSTGPAHPIVGEIGRSLVVTVLVLLTGAVAAPVVEETFFRGCLHTHLRHAFGRLGRPMAVGLAAVVSAFIFAAIHPQGWVAVPALMSLAIGFSLVREWRGGLIAPMTMHAINNGAVLGVLSLLMA